MFFTTFYRILLFQENLRGAFLAEPKKILQNEEIFQKGTPVFEVFKKQDVSYFVSNFFSHKIVIIIISVHIGGD